MKRSSFAGINQERVQLTGSGWRNTKENDLLCEYFSVVSVCVFKRYEFIPFSYFGENASKIF